MSLCGCLSEVCLTFFPTCALVCTLPQVCSEMGPRPPVRFDSAPRWSFTPVLDCS